MRFISLKLKENVGKSFMQLFEIGFVNNSGTDIISAAVVSASSESPAHPASNFLYGQSINDFWQSNSIKSTERVVFEIPEEYYGTLFNIIVTPASDVAFTPVEFWVEWSKTGGSADSEWITIEHYSAVQWQANTPKTFVSNFVFVDTTAADLLAANDKLKMAQLAFKLKNGEYILDDDAVFYVLGGDSVLATLAMAALDAGGGYDGLRTLGITDATALKVLATYNVKLDTFKYESEKGLDILIADPSKIVDFMAYLTTINLTLPSFNTYTAKLRSDAVIYAAVRDWAATLPVV